ncbi:MAG: altronate dehydratase, partial [Acidobacteriota bacterium]
MPAVALQLDPRDNVIVALATLEPGTTAEYGAGRSCPVAQTIPAKQKMALAAFNPGDLIAMYGMVVGEVTQPIPRGG